MLWRTRKCFLQAGGDRTRVKHPKGFMSLQNLGILTILYIGVIVFSWLFIFFYMSTSPRPVFFFRAVCGVIPSLSCAFSAPQWFGCNANSTKENPDSIYCISAVTNRTPCYNQPLSFLGTYFRYQWGFLIGVHFFLIYELLFVQRKQRDIFGNKHVLYLILENDFFACSS